MADEKPTTQGKSSKDIGSFIETDPATEEDLETLQEMEALEREGQTPIYNLFIKHGFKQEADMLYGNNQNRIGRYIAILDSNPVNKAFYTLAGLEVYNFLSKASLSKDKNKARRADELMIKLEERIPLSKLTKYLMGEVQDLFRTK